MQQRRTRSEVGTMKNKKTILLIGALVVIVVVVLVLCLKKTPEPAQETPAGISEVTETLEATETIGTTEMTEVLEETSQPETTEPPEPLDEDILLPKVGIMD